ncbi:ankyrin repeat domain-containing protein [Acinetobacter baumannii]|uniref:ankyrin repeat domain-containing protein n=1 Tax=Acinetobacter baumannii TaxID=470 RepID=UPI000BBB9849|nr:ankyrin repeat domain-containing protein [Acinetobacter baumannii]MDC4301681.1 ankyrin repeat domain-containing protein [Acinetobacter baumannii]MDC4642209.1 ankyrin repeat domain-containing protein [Acinetobacter baumannii]MDC4765185.1 ankyrin repeat domain-containing protein [Acinetobacter baumannii]MDC4861855.1 ankyrin repeat domain-containing protein [Acinetobacter baumannii]PCE47534.1 hypothetical protein CO267_01020 [Acinetobacter baumannii]
MHKSNIIRQNQENNILIRNAIKKHELITVKKIFSEFPGLLSIDTPFGSWLHVAASSGALEIVKYLITEGLSPNKKGGTFGGNSLNTAVSNGHIDIVEYLLLLNVEMDTTEPERNPLFGAIMKGSLPIVEKLISHDIDYKISYTGDYMNKMDAESFALERGEIEIANYLNSLK